MKKLKMSIVRTYNILRVILVFITIYCVINAIKHNILCFELYTPYFTVPDVRAREVAKSEHFAFSVCRKSRAQKVTRVLERL